MDLVVADAADEAFLLDLLNTTPVVDGTSATTSRIRQRPGWMRERGIAATDVELAALRRGHDRSCRRWCVVRRGRRPQAVRRRCALRPVATATGWTGGSRRATAPRARSARGAGVGCPADIQSGRLRPCANTECRLFLIDRSKPNTARWCSMAICGNRMKARRHYRRFRSASPDAGEIGQNR